MKLSPADRAAADQAIAATDDTVAAYIELAQKFELADRSRLSRITLYTHWFIDHEDLSQGELATLLAAVIDRAAYPTKEVPA